MKICIVFNKDSGSYQDLTESPEKRIHEILQAHNENHTIKVEEVHGNELTDTIKKYRNAKYDVIAAAGGDGTLNTFASELIGSEVTLGVVPMGTFNNFSQDAGIPETFDDAIRLLVEGEPKSIDTGEVNGHIFLNNSSVGVYPKAVLEREKYREKSDTNKIMAMSWALVKTALPFPAYTFKVRFADDEREFKTPMIFVGNNEYELHPLRIGSREKLTKGVLCGYIPHCETMKCLVPLLFMLFTNNIKLSERFTRKIITKLEIQSKKSALRVSLDGEVKKLKTPIKYGIRPKSLKVMLPKR